MKNWQFGILRYNKSMRYILASIFIILSSSVFSAEEKTEKDIYILDEAQALFGDRANLVANRLDSFFATERADDEFGRSRIRIRSQFMLREREVSDLENQYRINLRLPHLEQKFKYEYYQTEEEKKLAAEEKEKLKLSRINRAWLFNIDMGVSAAIPPKLITRARVRRSFETGTFIHRFVEQLTYTTDESGLVEETDLNSDYVFSDSLVFRFINNKRWRVLKKEFDTNHGPTLLHQLSENEAMSYSTTMHTVIDSGVWFVDNYRIAADYRRNLYKQWIYFDVITGLDFPKVWSFRRTPFITFQLEILFGG